MEAGQGWEAVRGRSRATRSAAPPELTRAVAIRRFEGQVRAQKSRDASAVTIEKKGKVGGHIFPSPHTKNNNTLRVCRGTRRAIARSPVACTTADAPPHRTEKPPSFFALSSTRSPVSISRDTVDNGHDGAGAAAPALGVCSPGPACRGGMGVCCCAPGPALRHERHRGPPSPGPSGRGVPRRLSGRGRGPAHALGRGPLHPHLPRGV